MAAPMNVCARNFLTKYRCFRYMRPGALCVTSCCRHMSQTSEEIVIPQKIHRSDTAILEALASTVNKVDNAPHYRYMDDPYLIPHSLMEKRSYALAHSSGAKAARYVLETFPRYLSEEKAMPPVEALMPPRQPVAAPASEAGVIERIEMRRVTDAWDAYQQSLQAGVSLSSRTVQRLLSLLCVHNSQDAPPTPSRNERWFHDENAADYQQRVANTWQENGFAESLFASLEEKTPESYDSMIRGKAKYYDTKRAYEMFLDARQSNVPLQSATYDGVLSISKFVADKQSPTWNIIKDILHDMSEAGVKPTLNTLNSALYALSSLPKRSRDALDAPQQAMQLINEMRAAGIEPSLGSWYYVVLLVYWHEEAPGDLLRQIVEHLKGQDLTYQHPADLEFFCVAMSRCFNTLQDLELAHSIHAILNHGNNSKLVGNNFKQISYYGNYLRLLCMFEQIDTIMNYYHSFVPHTMTPSLPVMQDLFEALNLNEGYHYLPGIWSDLILFDQSRNPRFVESMLLLMGKKKQEPQLQEQFQTIADAVMKKIQDDSGNEKLRNPLRLSGQIAGEVIRIMLNSGNMEYAWDTFVEYDKQKHRLQGFASEASLFELAKALLTDKETDKLLKVLKVMSDFGHAKLDEIMSLVDSTLELTEEQKSRMCDL